MITSDQALTRCLTPKATEVGVAPHKNENRYTFDNPIVRRWHDEEDEFFFTLKGKLIINIEGADSVELHPQQGYVVPKGVVHKTRAPFKTVVLMIESVGIIPTGNV